MKSDKGRINAYDDLKKHLFLEILSKELTKVGFILPLRRKGFLYVRNLIKLDSEKFES